MKQLASYVAAIIAVLSALFGVAAKWGEMNARITALENEQRYLHGDVRVPGAK